ncbi:polysaccharide lyase family 1 protein [Cylindrobasidium torrendii FP15055 ss-10]|uniref:Polysaccharide lyase family 1 protein n=1 Tax=Cylindrobasidium torrendii FP15055 ss-10 TaxID=1314674 RepID=A0A0D7BJL7_9AGAR|nr:polysaccharide lyase family 1 protein [Cylindrobasidium torrendii FP15055 ss-10]
MHALGLVGAILCEISAVLAAAPVDELVGFGAGVTGGGDAQPLIISTCDELHEEGKRDGAAVLQIETLLDGCGVLDIKSNKTVIGVGSNAGITNGGLKIVDSSNVIIRNLIFHLSVEEKDLLGLSSATNVWIDHCEFSNAGIVGDKDFYDGLLDITHGSDSVTVSWSKFYDHWKGSLIGASDGNGDEDSGHLRVSYHHNTWKAVNSRTPSIRFGTAHIYNSLYQDIPTSGINSRMGAQVLVENSIFSNVSRAIITDLDSDEDGFAAQRGNVFTSAETEITQNATWVPDYQYTCVKNWIPLVVD